MTVVPPTSKRPQRARGALLAMLALLLLAGQPQRADAHPADRLLQHLLITIYGDRIEATYALSGGLLATSALAQSIDRDGDGAFSTEEAQLWLQQFTQHITVSRAGVAESVDPANVALQVPSLDEFSLGLSPLLVTVTIPTGPMPQSNLRIDITNDYKPDLTDLRLDVTETRGGTLAEPVMPGRMVRLLVNVDPTVASDGTEAVDVANAWSATGVVSRAKTLFERPKTPWFVALMLLIFAGMGALHALQPGHGKTLVAAYLVATGGTPKDAMTLAGIVTATHTLSVYLLGMLTLLASEWFLPSRVIPVLSIVSGMLVVGMGVSMLWRSTRRWRTGADDPLLAHAHMRDHGHDHDHALLDDDAHARLHAAELDQVFVEQNGRRRVSLRQLVALGVSGGIAPCPDALAILLLAAGIGQAAFGMIAIVAFSIGLALILVAFGIAVAMLRPMLGRAATARRSETGWWTRANQLLDRLVVVSPVVSAVIVFGLGVLMLWGATSA